MPTNYSSGDGYGYGYGYGDGYGPGYGYSDGSGYGYSDGSGCEIGTIGEYRVKLLRPWRYVTAGCECHSVEWWRDNWRLVARQENVSISESQVEKLLCKITSCAAAQTDEQ